MYGIQVWYIDADGDVLEFEPSLETLGVYALTTFTRLRDAERAASALRATKPSRRWRYNVVAIHGEDQ